MADDVDYLLTTEDNPFSPFSQFAEWFAYDVSKGYNTCELLARFVLSSDELSDEDQALAIDDAMNELLELNITGNLIKVSEDFFKGRKKS